MTNWIRRLVQTLAAALMLAVLPTAPVGAEEIYTRSVKGVIDVAPDGTVAALEIEGDLGDAHSGYESMMREWRFNPILTSDGAPVDRTVQVRMRVDLYATRQGEGSFSMSTGRPTFEPVDDPGHMRRTSGIAHFPAPRYPERELANRHGAYEAHVLLLVQIGADGTVTKVGTRSAALLNTPARGGAAAAVRPFVREARNAAGRIRFVPSDEALREVQIPFRFSIGRDTSEEAWTRIVFVPRAGDAWVVERFRDAGRPPEELDGRGEPVDTRISLLTPIEDPWL